MSAKKNAAYNVAYRVFSILLPLVTAPYLTRTVGQTGKGLYDYAWSISEIFVIIATMGLTDYGVRAIAKVRDDAKQLSKTFSEIYIMQVLVSLLVLLGMAGLCGLRCRAGEDHCAASDHDVCQLSGEY